LARERIQEGRQDLAIVCRSESMRFERGISSSELSSTARGSAGELEYHLSLASDLELIMPHEYEELLACNNSIGIGCSLFKFQ
jgi:hypothetical protein